MLSALLDVVLLEGGPQRPQIPQAQRGMLGGTCNAAAPTTLNSRPQASANPSPSLLRGLVRRDARAACPTSRSPHSAAEQQAGEAVQLPGDERLRVSELEHPQRLLDA